MIICVNCKTPANLFLKQIRFLQNYLRVSVGFREVKKGVGGSSVRIMRDANYNYGIVLCPELIRVT
jgi:hypothetical protein